MKPATTAVSRPDAEVWITKEQAAKQLAVRRNGSKPQPISPRRILEFTQMGVLRSAKQRDPRSGQMMTVVSAADVERFRQERENPPTLPAIPNEPRPRLLGSAPKQDAGANHRPWLTLFQAEDYTGLPETFLQSLIDHGTLPALNVGIRPGGRWRVKRTDLDAIAGEPVGTVTQTGVK
jgi:excisionase family DNA binding protein